MHKSWMVMVDLSWDPRKDGQFLCVGLLVIMVIGCSSMNTRRYSQSCTGVIIDHSTFEAQSSLFTGLPHTVDLQCRYGKSFSSIMHIITVNLSFFPQLLKCCF